MGNAVGIRVLGPLAIEDGDAPSGLVAIGPSQRRMLAALCVHAGRVVASERLADMLGYNSIGAVRTTVHRLRQVTGDLIQHQAPGYIVEADNLDSSLFVDALSVAREADQASAVGLYDAALALWHGPAYVEFADEEWIYAESTRLNELRLSARAERIEAMLPIGMLSDAAADAQQLVRDEPLREKPRGLLMRALAMQGRQTEALRAYQDFRTFLADEAGLEPSEDLAALEGQILVGDLSVTAAPTAPTAPVATVQHAPRAAPAGTVTFLFADTEMPSAQSPEVAELDQLLHACAGEHDGWVFEHTNDGVCAAFSSAKAAIATAIDMQRRGEAPVRMGIATGEAEMRFGSYFGTVLKRAGRIMAAGHYGQIVVAATTAQTVDDVELLDLGNHHLHGLSEMLGLYQVQAEGLRAEFPPVNSETRDVGNLPAITHDLHGRSTEVQALTQLLQTQRMITLTGSGGVGKTSLALHVANSLAFEFPDGLWWIELAAVRDPKGVPDAVAAALGVTPNADTTLSENIATAIAQRRMLVVLDNCEHVLDAAADLASSMLAMSQRLAVVATSREFLRIAGERVWTVPPLDVTGQESPAVKLFLERSRAVSTHMNVAEDLNDIVDICNRLDGVPFAIELAAARTVSMSPCEIRDGLDHRFALLARPRRGHEHQQTLRQAVQWSYDLLDAQERELLNRLSIFVDGFDLASAGQVAANGGIALTDLIESLVSKSLLTTERALGRVRYQMLETIRDFAQQELVRSGQAIATGRRHAAHFAAHVKHQWIRWSGPEQRHAVDWVEVEFANLRAAFRFAVDVGDIEIASRVAAHTPIMSRIVQQYEPVTWAEEIIDQATLDDVDDLPVLYAAVALAGVAGRPEVTLRYGKLAANLELPPDADHTAVTWGAHFTAIGYRYSSQIDTWFELSSELAQGHGLARALGIFGMLTVPTSLDGPDQIRSLGEEAVGIARELDNAYLIASLLSAYGRSLASFDPDAAFVALREAHAMARSGKMRYLEAAVEREIAGLEAIHGQDERSLDYFATALESFQHAGDRASAAMALGALSAVLQRMNKSEAAATVFGSCLRFGSSRSAYVPQGLELPEPDPDDQVLAAAQARGQEMTFNEAIAFAQREIRAARSLAVEPL